MDLENLRRRGVSRTRLGPLTNLVRPALWRLMLPYLEEVARVVGSLERAVHLIEHRERLSADAARSHAALLDEAAAAKRRFEGKFTEVDARIEEAATQSALLAGRLSSRLASVHKDLHATACRLVSIEERLAGGIEAALAARADGHDAALRDMQAAVDELRRRAPPVESAATGLAVVSGPAGRFMVRPHDLVGGVVAGGGVWEPHVREAIERHADATRSAVDAGAYVGLHSVHMSRCFRDVHAFEPQPQVFNVLCGNLALNGCANVRAHNMALYDRACTMRLAPPGRQETPVPMRGGEIDYDAIGNAAGLVFEVQEDGTGPVRAAPLDSLGLGDVGFIKVDTQGADLRVLRGALETIRRCRPVIAFEYERDMAATHQTTQQDMLGFLDALDYETSVLGTITPDRQIDYIATPR